MGGIIDKILRKLGYISIKDLLFAVKNYDKIQSLKYDELSQKSSIEMDPKLLDRAIEEGYQGIGAMDFVSKLLNIDDCEQE